MIDFKSNGESRLKKRWEIIEHALWRPIRNSGELANAILSYNTKFKGIWKFRALHKLFEEVCFSYLRLALVDHIFM